MNSIQNANNRKLMTSLPDPEHHFKFRNLMKNATFQHKNSSFHHLSEQISTFIHHEAKLTFRKKHGSYRSHHSCPKDESIVSARWRQCALFSSLIRTLSYYTVPQVSVFYIARNIDETLTYNSVVVTNTNFNFLVIIF